MISRIEGTLVSVREGRAELQLDGICYLLLIPAHDEQHMAGRIGETVEFHTLHYLESQGQGSSYVPRLIGFRNPDDRAFFELFTTVKGLGNRKALRALQLPVATVAGAIAGEDLQLLTSLPEIGKRTAQSIVAELQDKVNRFVEVKPAPAGTAAGPDRSVIATDAMAVLVRLGESRTQARQLVERAVRAEPGLDTAEALVNASLLLKEG